VENVHNWNAHSTTASLLSWVSVYQTQLAGGSLVFDSLSLCSWILVETKAVRRIQGLYVLMQGNARGKQLSEIHAYQVSFDISESMARKGIGEILI